MAAEFLLAFLASGLAFTTPGGWRSSPAGSTMRVAEFVLPRVAGDPEDALLVVYYFGGSGGSVDANMQRWIGQMQQADSRPSSTAAKKETRTVNGLAVTLVDVSGTYIAEMAPGSTQRNNKPHFRLRAGVVETPRGPYFIKLTGPERTIGRWDGAFNQFVDSVRFQ